MRTASMRTAQFLVKELVDQKGIVGALEELAMHVEGLSKEHKDIFGQLLRIDAKRIRKFAKSLGSLKSLGSSNKKGE